MYSDKGTSYTFGIKAEQLARTYLESKGFIFINLRYKTPYGEIDLLMRDGDTLVAIEVKYRKHMIQSLYSISEKQKERIQNALLYYNQETLNNFSFLRFDVVLISPKMNSKEYSILHLENAW